MKYSYYSWTPIAVTLSVTWVAIKSRFSNYYFAQNASCTCFKDFVTVCLIECFWKQETRVSLELFGVVNVCVSRSKVLFNTLVSTRTRIYGVIAGS